MASHSGTDSNSDSTTCKFGVPFDVKTDFEIVPYETSMTKYAAYTHAAHAMIYALAKHTLWEKYELPGCVMMQMRFDGNLGFPGGLLNHVGETTVDGLNRELQEEIGLDLERYQFVETDHVITNVNHKKTLVTHFYSKQVTATEYTEIEKQTLAAAEWGIETFGVVRVPLYTMSDGVRGLPVFLANKFAGNAREQLLFTLAQRQIMSSEQLNEAVERYETYTLQTSK